MSQQLCVVESAAASPQTSLSRLLRPEDGFDCRCNHWNSFSNTELNSSECRLLLAVAVPETAEAVRFFRSRPRELARIPTLAVLPCESDEEVLRTVSDAVDDLVFWPVRELELRERIKRLIGGRRPDIEAAHRSLTQELGLAQVVGAAQAFVEVLSNLTRIGASDAPVLISGETGTGKEVCARAVHFLSRRRQGSFIPVDCGAIPEQLAESELFGHARGAFTDAHRDHKGLISQADGGTLFLDEVDALALTNQAKFLRFLQEGTCRSVGSEQFYRADVRIIAASNRILEQCVREKQFRLDLYFRLNVLQLYLPPLRERRCDIELLARHFLEKNLQNASRSTLSQAALRRLEDYDWPGNVRELFNVMQRAIVLSAGSQILPCHIVVRAGETPEAAKNLSSFRSARSEAIASFERRYVQEILDAHHGNITHAARQAGQDRRAFGRLAKKYRQD